MTVIDEIAAERRRQIEEEGWTPEHDDQHADGTLGAAAACYALPPRSRDLDGREVPKFWPWEPMWWKKCSRRRMLIKAGALIVAEIERLDRLAQKRSAA